MNPSRKICYLTLSLSSFSATAWEWSYQITWASTMRYAGTCYFRLPDNRPLQQSRQLVVGNDIEPGDIIYSWNYGEFLPRFESQCLQGKGVLNDKPLITLSKTNANSSYEITAETKLSTDTRDSSPFSGVRKTSINGIGLRLYIQFEHSCIIDGSSRVVDFISAETNSMSISCPTILREYLLDGRSIVTQRFLANNIQSPSNPQYKVVNLSRYNIRAELVKIPYIGNDNKTGQLSALSDISWTGYGGNNSGAQTLIKNDFLSGTGIIISSPSCQFKSTNKNQDVIMGTWVTKAINQRGPEVSIPLVLECSGSVNNVQFRFIDSGTSPSTNNDKNVTLYDESGSLINGLEIELRHASSGDRVNIDGLPSGNTGSYGTKKPNPWDPPLYHSTGNVNFTANYLQTNAIITSQNREYSGPIRGAVNVWVTHD